MGVTHKNENTTPKKKQINEIGVDREKLEQKFVGDFFQSYTL